MFVNNNIKHFGVFFLVINRRVKGFFPSQTHSESCHVGLVYQVWYVLGNDGWGYGRTVRDSGQSLIGGSDLNRQGSTIDKAAQ